MTPNWNPRPKPNRHLRPVDSDAEPSNVLLDENLLVALAMRELKGRRPPGYDPYGLGEGQGKKSTPPPPGVRTLLARELEARGWTARELAQATGLSPTEASALAKGNLRVTPEIAQVFAKVFATSVEFWLGKP